MERTERFKRDFQALPEPIQRRTEKQLALFLQNPRHPSLGIKKLEGMQDIWEGRITRNYRFTFEVHEDHCTLRRIGTHDILRTP
ncbi:MAG: hypothetical protein M1423_01375 [Acidobacteria bacterium]|nr:hypothetical protein [Acidobacteriota bacterium]